MTIMADALEPSVLADLRACTGCGMPAGDCIAKARTGATCCTICDHPWPPALPEQQAPDDGLW